jgi:tripartite-type tricarboxylate transporter receptor subunit TctC
MFSSIRILQLSALLNRRRRKFLQTVLSATLVSMTAGSSSPAFAAYPDRPIVIVVPFSAGGSTDVLARLLARPMQEMLKQPVIVENRVGAAGAIGAAYVAKSNPDGYTVLFGGVGTNILNPLTIPETPYNPQKDLAAVGEVCTVDYVLVVKADSPFKSLSDVIAKAKAQKDSISYMSTGNKGPLHLGMAYLSKMAGVSLIHAPYKGESAALPDVLAGRVDIGIMTVPFTAPLIREGKLRAIASVGNKRSTLLPQVPTVAESGFPTYALPIWIGLSVPAATAKERIDLLNRALHHALSDSDVKSRMSALGVSPVGSSPSEFSAFQDRERERWLLMIKESGTALDK